MSDTLMRQWSMLRFVPRHPKKISTLDIQNSLANVGFKISQRSIQRDLMTLSDIFPLVCDERSKPYGWSWMHDGEVMDIPGMDSHTALAFHLTEKHLRSLLPKSTLNLLAPHFKTAEKVLSNLKKKRGTPSWTDKVRVLNRGPDLKAPTLDSEIQLEVYDALLLNRKLEITYNPRAEKGTKEYQVNPLGLVFKDGIFYLVCSFWDYPDIRLITLHRILSAKLLDIPSRIHKVFNLDEYIASGELDFIVGGKIKLEALFSKEAAFHLHERPLSSDQTLVEQDNGHFLLTATVLDTSELRWWLMGFGAQIEVLSPKSIREDLSNNAKALSNMYNG